MRSSSHRAWHGRQGRKLACDPSVSFHQCQSEGFSAGLRAERPCLRCAPPRHSCRLRFLPGRRLGMQEAPGSSDCLRRKSKEQASMTARNLLAADTAYKVSVKSPMAGRFPIVSLSLSGISPSGVVAGLRLFAGEPWHMRHVPHSDDRIRRDDSLAGGSGPFDGDASYKRAVRVVCPRRQSS